MPITGGATQTSAAFSYAQNYVFAAANGSRSDPVAKALVVVTDGCANAGYQPGAAAAALRASGVDVFVLGVVSGTAFDQANARAEYLSMTGTDHGDRLYVVHLPPRACTAA